MVSANRIYTAEWQLEDSRLLSRLGDLRAAVRKVSNVVAMAGLPRPMIADALLFRASLLFRSGEPHSAIADLGRLAKDADLFGEFPAGLIQRP